MSDSESKNPYVVELPTHLDESEMFLFWPSDEAMPFIFAFLFGFMMEMTLVGILFGYLIVKAQRKFKDMHPNGYLQHLVYWYLGAPLKGRTIDNPFIREYRP